jgi:hypothetical protein
MGQESPLHLPSLQQSQDIAFSPPEASFFFIGQESFLQHDILSAAIVLADRVYANAAIAKAKVARIASSILILFFMIVISPNLEIISSGNSPKTLWNRARQFPQRKKISCRGISKSE